MLNFNIFLNAIEEILYKKERREYSLRSFFALEHNIEKSTCERMFVNKHFDKLYDLTQTNSISISKNIKLYEHVIKFTIFVL